MGKNSDHKNIFESYYNNVVLNEQTDLSKEDIVNLYALLKTATGDAKKAIQAEIDKRLSQVAPAQQPKEVYKGNEDNSDLKWDEHSSTPATAQPAPETATAQPAPASSQGTVDKYEDESPRYKPNDELPEDPALASITAPIQPQPQQATQPKTQSSGGGSLVDYLASKGQQTDKASRAKLAAQYGIQNYDFSAGKNTELLKKLQSGEKPSVQGTEQAQQSPQSGGISKTVGDAGTAIKKGLIGSEAPLGGALGAVSKGIGGAGNLAKGAVGGASKAIGGAGNLVKKGLIGSDQPLGGALGAVSKGLGSIGNVPKNIGNLAKGAVGGASKAIGGAGNLAKQGITGQKEPMGGILGGISKGLGSIGNVAKRAVGGSSPKDEGEEYGVNEKTNIAKFLKCLSEKDYSKANKYLKTIVDNKINRNVLKNINNK